MFLFCASGGFSHSPICAAGNVLLMSTVTSMVMHCLERCVVMNGRLAGCRLTLWYRNRLAVFNPSPIVFCVPPTWDKEWILLPRAVQRLESPYLCAEVRPTLLSVAPANCRTT